MMQIAFYVWHPLRMTRVHLAYPLPNACANSILSQQRLTRMEEGDFVICPTQIASFTIKRPSFSLSLQMVGNKVDWFGVRIFIRPRGCYGLAVYAVPVFIATGEKCICLCDDVIGWR